MFCLLFFFINTTEIKFERSERKVICQCAVACPLWKHSKYGLTQISKHVLLPGGKIPHFVNGGKAASSLWETFWRFFFVGLAVKVKSSSEAGKWSQSADCWASERNPGVDELRAPENKDVTVYPFPLSCSWFFFPTLRDAAEKDGCWWC